MKLQLALDFTTLADAMKIAENLKDAIDILEIGTPWIIQEGISVVRKMKEAFPDLTILADLKIMDAGEHEAAMAFNAGADIVTVLGFSGLDTIAAVVKQAGLYQRQVMVDMIGIDQISRKGAQIDQLGVDYICVHTAIDRQHRADPLVDLQRLNKVLSHAQSAVAGGITLATLPNFIKENPDIVIVGSGITKAQDKRQAAFTMQALLKERRN